MRPLHVLHLSDFHMGKDPQGQEETLRELGKHIAKQSSSRGRLDLILITGDIANKGRPDEYALFWEGLQAVLPNDGAWRDRLFLVPGNHDVDRQKAQSACRYDALENAPHFFDPNSQGLGERRLLKDRFGAYLTAPFKKTTPTDWLFEERGCFDHILNIDGIKIGILLLNTAWLSRGDEDRHKLGPGKSLLKAGLEKLDDVDIRIVLGHHPPDWWTDQQATHVRKLFGDSRVLYLHGHTHQTDVRLEDGGDDGHYLVIGAGSIFQAREDERWVNGFQWYTLNIETGMLIIEPFHWIARQQRWCWDAAAFPEKYRIDETNRWQLPLPGRKPMPAVRKVRPPWRNLSDLAPVLDQIDHEMRVGRYDAAVQLIQAIDELYLFPWGKAKKVIELREALLEKLGNETDRANNSRILGLAYRKLGKFQIAMTWFEEYQSSVSSLGFDWDKGIAKGLLASAYLGLGQLKEARSLHEEALEINKTFQRGPAQSINLGELGAIERLSGNLGRAIALYQKAFDLDYKSGNIKEMSYSLANLGYCHLHIGKFLKAHALYRGSLKMDEKLGEHESGKHWKLIQFGKLHYSLGNFDKATKFLQNGLDLSRQIGDLRWQVNGLSEISNVLILQGRNDDALEQAEAALNLADEVKSATLRNLAHKTMALIQLENGEIQRAAFQIGMARRHDFPLESHFDALIAGLIQTKAGKRTDAIESYRKAMTMAGSLLKVTPDLWKPRFVQGVAATGLAIHGQEPDQNLKHARGFISHALDTVQAEGIRLSWSRLLNHLKDHDTENHTREFQVLLST